MNLCVSVDDLCEIRMMMHAACLEHVRDGETTQHDHDGLQRPRKHPVCRVGGVHISDESRNGCNRRGQSSTWYYVDQMRACASEKNHTNSAEYAWVICVIRRRRLTIMIMIAFHLS